MDALKAIAASALLALAASPALAARDQFGDKDPVTIDRTKAYIFYRSQQRVDVRFLREVSADQRARHDAERGAAYEKARAKYETKFAQWQKDSAAFKKVSNPNPSMKPKRPDEVTEATFAYAPPELGNFVTVKGGREFTKAKPDYSYLLAVEPGTYILYGQISQAPNGSVLGACNCMGSAKFAARAGEIVDLGVLRYPSTEATVAVLAAKPANRALAMEQGLKGTTLHALVPPDASTPLPPKLAGLPVTPAEYRAAGKMPNYFGVLIDRLAPMPGVLAYRRDTVVDVRTGTDVAAGAGGR